MRGEKIKWGKMKGEKKSYSSEWKAKIALEAIKGQRTINEMASEYKVHPTQIMNWKKTSTGVITRNL